MKILITGGSGLIGSNLIPILRPCDVTAYTRNVAMAEQILGHKIHFSNLNDVNFDSSKQLILILGNSQYHGIN